jgi:hypothetical protein
VGARHQKFEQLKLEQDELLYRLLFGPLPLDKFCKQWIEDVSEPGDEVCLAVRHFKLPKYGRSTLYVFASQLVALEDEKGRWSAFETAARVEERSYYAAWGEFCRGTWIGRIPQEEGTYPTRDREGARGKDRTLRRIEGRLRDVTCCSGMVAYGQVSNWRGEWWSSAYPPLKGAVG